MLTLITQCVINKNMIILNTKWFRKWAKKNKLTDYDLIDAVGNFQKGLSSTELGSNLFKIRVARKNRGKSAGFRTIIAYQENDRTIFLYGFAKNDKSNIDKKELITLKTLGRDLLCLNSDQIKIAQEDGLLFELKEE